MHAHDLRASAAPPVASSTSAGSSSSMRAKCRASSSCDGGAHLPQGSSCTLQRAHSSRSSRARSSRRVTLLLLLVVAALACCSITAVSACSHHQPPHGSAAAAATKCSAPAAPALHKASRVSAAAGVGEEPVSIVYQEVSEAQLAAEVAAAAARRRQLLQDNPAAAPAVEAAVEAAAADVVTATDTHHTDLVQGGGADDGALPRSVRRCGASELTPEEVSQVALSLEQHRLRRSVLQRARLSSASAAAAFPTARTSLNVPLYFHVITGKKVNSTVDAPQELLLKQLQAMNDAYGQHSIRFDLKGITRVQSEAWAVAEINSAEENLMKSKLRKGGLGDLNIYVIRPTSGTLGWSTFPWEAVRLGESFDGVLVHVGTMPGGTMKPYNKGYTMVHEVGHWLGLLHVFENGCDTPGDSVDDTAPQASAAYGCPKLRHTCPNSNEPEPVHNIMSYTDDTCMTGFTRGQADRVLAMWDVYRARDEKQQQQQQQQQQQSSDNVVTEKSTSQAITKKKGQQSGGQGSTTKQTVKKQQGGGVALLEQGTMDTRQLPESVHLAPNGKQQGRQMPGAPATTKQQRSSPAAPRWGVGNWLAANPLITFNAPGAMLEATAQVKKAQEQQQQQQGQEKQQEKRKSKKRRTSGWSSWISIGGSGAGAAGGSAAAPVQAGVASSAAAYQQQQLQPEMGQYVTQQQLQQLQYQYAQQQQYAQPQGPQYVVGGYASDAASSQQAALLAAMGGLQAFPMAAVYDGAGAGGFNVATAAVASAAGDDVGSEEAAVLATTSSSKKHGKGRNKRKSKGSRG